jgi:hypothetical protein
MRTLISAEIDYVNGGHQTVIDALGAIAPTLLGLLCVNVTLTPLEETDPLYGPKQISKFGLGLLSLIGFAWTYQRLTEARC